MTLPDTNQGIEIRDFNLGIEMADSNVAMGAPDFLLDGVAFYQCLQAINITNSYTAGAVITYERGLIRSTTPPGAPVPPLIEVLTNDLFQNRNTSLVLTLESLDIRPGTSMWGGSAIGIASLGSENDDDFIRVNLRNLKITGQSTINPIPGPISQQYFRGAGVEVGLKHGAIGRYDLENVLIRDARAEGFLGFVTTSGASGTFSATNVSLIENGSDDHASPYLPSMGIGGATFSESGLHLAAREGGTWTVDEGRESHFDRNYRHGVFLEASSFHDEADGFPLAEFDLCTFTGNGLELTAEQGHGLHTFNRETTMDLRIHRSALSSNLSGGIQMYFDDAETSRSQRLEITNSTLSENGGGGAVFFNAGVYPLDTNPVSVVSVDDSNSLETRISQVTISDNPTPYAIAFYGTNPSAQVELWAPGSSSTIDNGVLKENGFTPASGGAFSDQAWFPEPPSPLGGGQWEDIFDRTYFSNLGNELGVSLPAYTPDQGNFYSDPQLTPFTFMNIDLGVVFPSATSPLIDAGGASPFATEATDNRGPGNPRLLGNTFDVGAFELQ